MVIDLRSDTVTKPSQAMKDAMLNARARLRRYVATVVGNKLRCRGPVFYLVKYILK